MDIQSRLSHLTSGFEDQVGLTSHISLGHDLNGLGYPYNSL